MVKYNIKHIFLLKLLFMIKCTYISKEINHDSIIKLVVSGKGIQKFLSNSYIYEPSEVIINGISKGNICKKSCTLDYSINNITLIFNYSIDTCKYMFEGLKNITQIDLKNFDTSGVTDMTWMFRFCVNLESIDVSKFNTSLVKSMYCMFCNCYKLIELNLSNFDTSQVTDMNDMFSGCYDLKNLDLSNFVTSNVTSMNNMFSRCYDLIYLDLSNFNTSKVSSVESMFYGCESLISLNLYSFKIKKGVKKDMFNSGINSKVKYCINDIETKIIY